MIISADRLQPTPASASPRLHQQPRTAGVSAIALIALSVTTVTNAAESVEDPTSTSSASVTLTTDYVFRGVSQTLSRPALQLGAEIGFANGIYAYAWASNIDFVKSTDTDDGARWELDLALAYATDVSEYLSVDLGWVRYTFPGTNRDIDYEEWIASLYFPGNYRLTAGYSDDVFGTADEALFYEAGAKLQLPGDLYLSIEGGYYDLRRAYLDGYRYGSLAIGRQRDLFGWKLAYHSTDSKAENIFYASVAESRLVAALQFEF